MIHDPTLHHEACQVLSLVLMAAWCFVGASSLYDLARGVLREQWWWTLLLAGIYVLGATLALSLATWGPGDDQFRHGHFYVRSFHISVPVCRPDLGGAPDALWRLLPIPVESADTAVIVVTALAGALAPVFLALFLDLVGAGRLSAVAAGALLALQPVAIRWAGSMGRSTFVLLLSTLALWALARARPHKSVRSLVVFVLAAWLCARSRPEAGLVLAVAGLVFLAFRLEVGRWVRDPWTWLQGGALAIAGAVSVVHFAYMSRYVAAFASKLDVIMGKNLLEAFSPRRVLWLDPDYTSVAVIALFAVGIVWGLVHARRATIWAVSALFVVVLMGPPDQSGGLKLAYSRYQSLPLMLFCVIAGIGASGVVDLAKRGFGKLGRGVAAAALLVAVPLTSAGPVGRVCRATTIDLELQFLKDALMELPECAVIFAPFGPKVDVSGGFRDAWAVSFWLGRGKWREWPLDEPTPGCEKYFYRSPLCHVDTVGALASYPSAAVIFERCREGMTRAGDRPAVVTKLRPVPWGGETYPRERIEIGFYKLSE